MFAHNLVNGARLIDYNLKNPQVTNGIAVLGAGEAHRIQAIGQLSVTSRNRSFDMAKKLSWALKHGLAKQKGHVFHVRGCEKLNIVHFLFF